MIWCGIIYAALILAVVLLRNGHMTKRIGIRELRQMLAVMAAANTLALLLFLSNGGSAATQEVLVRNEYGKGERTEEREMSIEGKVKKQMVQIQIQDRKYNEEETKTLFQKVIAGLDKIVLGKNQSKDCVTEDLNFIQIYPETPVELEWQVNRYDVITAEGKIQESKLSKEGILVEIKGLLHYQEEEALYETTVMVFPKEKMGMEKIIFEVQEQIEKEDDQMKEEEVVRLPDRWNGLPIIWRKPGNENGYMMLGLGIFGAFAIVFLKKENEKKEAKKREKQMLCDYPEIVSQIVLLLGAGMTMKNVWMRIAADHKKQAKGKERRYVYEEMEHTIYEMQSGITEADAYERFGRRCELSPYRKLGALLSQNVRKGTKGLADLLSVEAVQAFEERKSLARKLGEEAGTKLLLPMFLMLAIVMAIIIIPAFLSIQI